MTDGNSALVPLELIRSQLKHYLPDLAEALLDELNCRKTQVISDWVLQRHVAGRITLEVRATLWERGNQEIAKYDKLGEELHQKLEYLP